MTPWLLSAFLCICLLCPRPSHSQAPVVTLPVGAVVKRPLIGLTPAHYERVRRARELDSLLLGVRAERIRVLRRDSLLAGQAAEAQATELMRCRVQAAARDNDYDALAGLARVLEAEPKARPLLLSPAFYKGAGAGAAAVFLLKLFLFPQP